eukprot:TRINITY_DN72448_c0_g1_i1.p1 TRINITY_DN72448_c0_g1~~TRINITY_DN72448_c0_g1_i1.p1  ORF type:complete len:631 (+),score=77.97 TRINITY_DN72448_c0_g1_i1:34-1926(+)
MSAMIPTSMAALALIVFASAHVGLAHLSEPIDTRISEKSRLAALSLGVPRNHRTGLSVNVASVVGHETTVEVTWSDANFALPTDWIGMWPSDVDIDVFSSPMKFKYLTGIPKYDCLNKANQSSCTSDSACSWFRGNCAPASPSPSGKLTFRVLNQRTDVVFMYISGNIQYPGLISKSEVVKIKDRDLPQGGHLAVGKDHTQMRVYWQAGGAPVKPGVRYGTTCDQLNMVAVGEAKLVRQYKKEDMCDRQKLPAGRQGWFSPGTLLEATLTDLVPGKTYCYSYGDDATGWNELRSFVAAPVPGPRWPTTVAAFGDLGQVEADGAHHHSWDFENRGELPSSNTTRALASDTSADFVLHIGDISYAVGYMSQWDNFFRQIYPVATTKPWMTAIGNHEVGWSGSFYAGEDSGGECGVPYNAYFPFASQDEETNERLSTRRPWYAFKYGPATFVQMSTEHDFTKGSDQHRWLELTLRSINRSETPWVVFSGHRPMYVPSDFAEDHAVSKDLRDHVEPLLLENHVDVALWAHFHAFSKTCKLRDGQCDDTGVQHFVIGMAGYDHSDCSTSADVLSRMSCSNSAWGYVRMIFNSESDMKLEFVDSATGQIAEAFEIQANAGRVRSSALEAGSDLVIV